MLPVIVLLFEFVILSLYKSSGVTAVGNTVTGLLIFIHTLSLIAYFNQNKKLKPYSKALVISLFFRIILIDIDLFAYPSFVLPNGHSDEDMFFANAVWFANTGISYRGSYPKVMGLLFRFVGFNRLYGQYLSMLFSIVALTILANCFSLVDISSTIKSKVFSIVCFLPNFAILSSLFMREALITMILSASFYLFLKWITEKKGFFYLLAIVLVLPAAILHSGTIAVLVGYIVIRLIYNNKQERVSVSLRNVLVTLIIAFGAVYVINSTGSTFLGKFGDVDSLEDIANTGTSAASSYAQYVGNSNSPVSFIVYTPLRLFFFLFSPVPWMWRGMADITAFMFSSLYYLVTILSVLKYLRLGEATNKRNRVIVISLFVVALATSFVFAWGTSNAGTASRHRDKMVTLMAILWALSSDGAQKAISANQKNRRRYVRDRVH